LIADVIADLIADLIADFVAGFIATRGPPCNAMKRDWRVKDGESPHGASEDSICFIETDGSGDRACRDVYLANLAR
jgi:hypothetical protein